MVCVEFYIIGYDPKVFHQSAKIAMSIADEVKDLCMWGGHLKSR